jgi:hypothetical protein
MLCLDTERRQRAQREIAHVECDDHAGIASNRCGKHMTVIGVRQ